MIRKKICFVWGFILIALFLFSCSENKQKKPENLLGKEKMEAILNDCFLAESYAVMENLNLTDSARRAFTQAMYADIFEKHGVTKQKFEQSYDYYSANAKNMEEMFRGVISKLDSIQPKRSKKDTIEQEEIKSMKVLDSILIPIQEIEIK